MPYSPSSDFVGLWHSTQAGVEKAQMPGLDFVVQALGRAGILKVITGQTPPTSSQSTTAWFRPTNPSYVGEGSLFLWDGTTYVPATPALFHSNVTVPAVGGVTDGSDVSPGQVGEFVKFTYDYPYPFGGSSWAFFIGTLQPGDWDLTMGGVCNSAINFIDFRHESSTTPSPGFSDNLRIRVTSPTASLSTWASAPVRALTTVPTVIEILISMDALAAGIATTTVTGRRRR